MVVRQPTELLTAHTTLVELVFDQLYGGHSRGPVQLSVAADRLLDLAQHKQHLWNDCRDLEHRPQMHGRYVVDAGREGLSPTISLSPDLVAT